MNSQLGDILHQQQIKEIIAKLTQLDIKDYCSSLWLKQDENLQKLNMQLHVNALMKNDQYILEECITQDKYKILIYDLIASKTWKKKVLPLIKNDVKQLNSLKIYMAVYHEAVICNMLEVFMFHRTAVDESGEFLIEIIDYCYHKISKQVSDRMSQNKAVRKQEKISEQKKKQKALNEIINRTPVQQFETQINEIQFNLFIMSISILRYVTDYIKHLQIGILHHILIQSNIFSLLVPLIEERPWLRTNSKGERQIFENGKWNVVPKSQYGRLPKTEAQVWIAIYNLFMDPQCRKKYQLNDQRKNTLLRVRKYMNEVLLDQIPNLSFMLRSLEELSMMNVPTHLTTNPFVVQQIPIIETAICKDRDWQALASEQKIRLMQSMDESQKKHIQKLADLYSNNNVEGLVQGFKCKKCSKDAFKRCSKCKNAWYCCRECQVADWPNHKLACNQRTKELKEAEEKKRSPKEEVNLPHSDRKQLIDELD